AGAGDNAELVVPAVPEATGTGSDAPASDMVTGPDTAPAPAKHAVASPDPVSLSQDQGISALAVQLPGGQVADGQNPVPTTPMAPSASDPQTGQVPPDEVEFAAPLPVESSQTRAAPAQSDTGALTNADTETDVALLPEPAFGKRIADPEPDRAVSAVAATPAPAPVPAKPMLSVIAPEPAPRNVPSVVLAPQARDPVAVPPVAKAPTREEARAPSPAAAAPVPSRGADLALADLPEPLFGLPSRAQAPPPPPPLPAPVAQDDTADMIPALREVEPPEPLGAVAVTPDPATPSRSAALGQGPGRKLFPVSDSVPEFSYDDELILRISVTGTPGDDTVIAYGTREGIYLPFGELVRLLDLAITVSDEGHFASGWFLDEKRTISLDLRQRKAILAGKEVPIAKSDAVSFDGELYLRSDKFGEYFPLRITPDLRDQAIHIKTLEPFPFEERMAREAQRAKLNGQGPGEAKRWPREETPWRALSLPMADVELRAVSDNGYGTRGEADLRVAGDLAFLTAQAYLAASTRDGLTSAHVAMGRRDPDADLLGPLGATEFQVGDIATAQMPMGLRGTAGRGFAVTNAPLESVSVFDKLDLRGVLPTGYEVELYRNDVLLGSTRQAIDGQYEFLQVPLDFGVNVLRLVFYGPQGQRSEEVRRINVGDGRLAKGEAVYNFGMVQKDRNLLGVTGPRFRPGRDYAKWRASGELAYGISSGVTASLGAAWFDTDDGRRKMATASVRTGLLGMAAKLDLGLQDKGARAVGAGLGGRLFGAAFRLEHVEYTGDFFDEVKTFTGDRLKRATELDFNANVDLGTVMLPISGRTRRLDFRDGNTQLSAALRTSLRFSGVVASNTLEYSRNTTPGFGASDQLAGAFDLATLSRSRFQARASLGYRVLPGPHLSTAALEGNYAIDDRTQVRGSIAHSFDDSDTQLGLSGIRYFGPVSLALDGYYAFGSKTYNAALRLGFSFGRNPMSERFYLAESGSALSGAVAVRAFHDRDGDGVYGPADAVLPGVAFTGGARAVEANEEGIALIEG
ncbi:MAG: hypothetical protein H6816_15585, partial [Phycisphaerales bacterium]|nr:hypothetical protein [Phycisphaerales bacterium]